eukprot:TRINITY_DN3048_c0_g1_i2.p1 TRINITY_DN3048_c0_g1~~TRINITY_DN3048_c0_g1_i2.p1  ORF type:complete len:1178 (+),score=153.68 TRINITY_DN3048_c0_g1_i2:253-3786(+)
MARDVSSGRLSAEVRDLVAQADIFSVGSSNIKEPQRPVSARPGYKRPVSATWKPPSTLPDRAGQESRASTQAPSRTGAASPDSTVGTHTPTQRPSGVYDSCFRGSQAFGGLALPTTSRRIGATRLDSGVLGKMRPDSAGHRPSTAPNSRRHVRPGSAFTGVNADGTQQQQIFTRACGSTGPSSSPRFGSRPGTAPPETVHGVPRSSMRPQTAITQPQTATVRQQQLERDASSGDKVNPEGDHWDVQSSADEEFDFLGDLTNDLGKTIVPVDVSRRDRLKQLAEDPAVKSLHRRGWQPQVWLALRKDAIDRNEKYLIPYFLRIALASTNKAIQEQMYEVYCPCRKSPKVMKVRLEEETPIPIRDRDTFETVDFSHVWCSPPCTRWYANPKKTQTWDDHQPPKVGREAAVVNDVHPLNSAVAASKSMPGMPIMLVAEVTDFDEHGDIDPRSLSSLGPDDLLLRTDLSRFLENINRDVRGSNHNNAIKCNTIKDYMQDPSSPFLIRCKDVQIFRGPLEDGFPFLKEPVLVDVILMAMAHPRPKLMRVNYQTAPSTDWYDDVGQYNTLIERLDILSHIARVDMKEEHNGTKPILIMNVPGAYSNIQQPWDAVKTCLKHWKHTFFGDFHSFQICCRNRYGPDMKLAGLIRKAVNSKPRPAPGLDIDERRTRATRKKLRLQGGSSVLSDPSEDEEDVDASLTPMEKMVRQVRKENCAEMIAEAEGQKGWTEEKIFGFLSQKREVYRRIQQAREEHREGIDSLLHKKKHPGFMLSQAIAMANQAKEDAFGFVATDHDFISSSDDEGESSDQGASWPAPPTRSYSEKAVRRKPKINHSFARFASRSAVALIDESARSISTRRKTEARMADIHALWEKHMERKVEEMQMLRDLSKRSLAAKAAQRTMEHNKFTKDRFYEQRANTSITGKLGAGEDFHTYFGGTLEEFGDSKAMLVGRHVLQGADDHARPLLSGRDWVLDQRQNTDSHTDLRSETRQGFQDPEHCFSRPESPRSAKLPVSPSSKTNKVARHHQGSHEQDKPVSTRQILSQKRQVTPFKTATLGEAKEHYHRDTVIPTDGKTLLQMIAAQIEAEKEAEEKAERSEDRPFASKDVQFRRRTLRETTRIYRSTQASNLTKAGLRDVEVATADHEAEILKLAGQVQERMARFVYEDGEAKAKSPWLHKFQS